MVFFSKEDKSENTFTISEHLINAIEGSIGIKPDSKHPCVKGNYIFTKKDNSILK